MATEMISILHAFGLCLGIATLGFGSSTLAASPTTYVLTVDSKNPAAGVAIGVTPEDVKKAGNGTTSFKRTYDVGTMVTLTAPAKSVNNVFVSWSGCASSSTVTCKVTLKANTTVTANYAQTHALTVDSTDPSSGVTIDVTPSDVNKAGNGATGFTRIYRAATAVTLTAPAQAGSHAFVKWSGCTSSSALTCKVTLSANTTVTAAFASPTAPTMTVTPAVEKIANVQSLNVTVDVSGPAGKPAPTGTVKLASGKYTSSPQTLSAGAFTFSIPMNSLAAGSDKITAAYTPSAASSSVYTKASGTSSPVTVIAGSAVAVDQSSTGPPVTDQLMGMNMAVWVDPTTPEIVPAFATAGIKAVRWPGGSESDDYHWKTNTVCNGGYSDTNATYENFTNSLVIPSGVDVALTANYGTDAACTGPGDPTEAAAWAAEALAKDGHVSHITVGNEQYGTWETDLHAKPNDAATYASAAATGYYPDIKAADPAVLVGVSVNPGNDPPWDPIVLADAKYDFVEYHYYPQGPGEESDTFLVRQAAQELTGAINEIKAELATAGHPDTPIYVGEMGSVYTLPGRQSSSITQALYAGQVLGEMMNDGVSRATWWIGFGGCDDKNSYRILSNGTRQYANFDTPGLAYQTDVYGWQNFGGYMVFSDGTPEYGCESATPVPTGTLLPTARAYQLFSKVAISGESVLTASVAGDTTDVRAYAATNNGGTALVLFNLNETVSEPVVVTLSKETTSSGVTVETYSKAIYDQSKTNVWAPPTTTSLGAQSLPLVLVLDPWSMNVVIIK